MSRANVEVFERAVAAYNRRDIDSFLEAFDPEVEWHSLTQVMFGGEQSVHRGHSGIRDGVREIHEVLAELQLGYSEIRDLGERIVVVGRVSGRGRASGAETEMPINWVIEFRNSKVIRMRDYVERAEALEAAGLSE
jgi:ketosteroid isomerase-like protein